MKKNNRNYKKRLVSYEALDKVAELQRKLCEYERFEEDLLLFLIDKNPKKNIIKKDLPHSSYIFTEIMHLIEFKNSQDEKL